jgi:hypothetical protein
VPKRKLRRLALLATLAALCATAQAQTPSPSPSASPAPAPAVSAPPGIPGQGPTPPPITVEPAAASVPVGSAVNVIVGSAIAPITVTVADSNIATAAIDPASQRLVIVGKAAGATVVTLTDARGVRRDVPVRVAFFAGTIPPSVTVDITGDPADAAFVREQVAREIKNETKTRPGAQVLVSSDDVPFHGTLNQDDVAAFDVRMLIQARDALEVDGSTHVEVRNIAVPRISPDSLMVSDYPERLTENGTLFTADLRSSVPSRFLYFHYNPPGQPDRRIVLRAQNLSREPSIVQMISGRGGPSPNEMEVGHVATKRFLIDLVQNQGRLITIDGSTSANIVVQDLPAAGIVCNLLQLRVLSGGNVHLTLVAQDATADPNDPIAAAALLETARQHARGIYPIAEFHFATQWRVDSDYLELPIGHLPLPNDLHGQALAGDYGVLQSFVVNVQNPLSSPQTFAIYENPRGGRATGTYIIDGVLVQSHQVPPYSRYKVRQYVAPAHGFVRVTIVTMPEAGSSLPLRLVFAPDDGSVAPGAPGSPIY